MSTTASSKHACSHASRYRPGGESNQWCKPIIGELMNLLALPAFADNYLWMLHDGHRAIVVDPGQAAPVAEALSRLGLQLPAILVTHHHADHVGGVGRPRPESRGRAPRGAGGG